MRKRFVVALGAALVAMTAAAQNTKQAPDVDSAGAANKIIAISGSVGPGGKTLAASKVKTVWSVTNPEALLDNIGQQVSVRARALANSHEIEVIAVRIDPTVGARLHDAAFRR